MSQVCPEFMNFLPHSPMCWGYRRHPHTQLIVLVIFKSSLDGEVFLDTCFPNLCKNSLWENTVILLELTQSQPTKEEKGRSYS